MTLEVIVALILTLGVVGLLVAEEEPSVLVGALYLHDVGHGILERDVGLLNGKKWFWPFCGHLENIKKLKSLGLGSEKGCVFH